MLSCVHVRAFLVDVIVLSHYIILQIACDVFTGREGESQSVEEAPSRGMRSLPLFFEPRCRQNVVRQLFFFFVKCNRLAYMYMYWGTYIRIRVFRKSLQFSAVAVTVTHQTVMSLMMLSHQMSIKLGRHNLSRNQMRLLVTMKMTKMRVIMMSMYTYIIIQVYILFAEVVNHKS